MLFLLTEWHIIRKPPQILCFYHNLCSTFSYQYRLINTGVSMKEKYMTNSKSIDWLIILFLYWCRNTCYDQGVGLWCLTPLSTIFQYIVAVSFTGGGNQRKPPTFRKSLTNCITSCCIEYAWAEFEVTKLVVIFTDCICSCKSNHHTITTTIMIKSTTYLAVQINPFQV